MNDKLLLEKAAKAAGIDLSGGTDEHGDYEENWNPLENDGDAFRLAVHLRMSIDCDDYANMVEVYTKGGENCVSVCFTDTDAYAATRRAITLAAAGMFD